MLIFIKHCWCCEVNTVSSIHSGCMKFHFSPFQGNTPFALSPGWVFFPNIFRIFKPHGGVLVWICWPQCGHFCFTNIGKNDKWARNALGSGLEKGKWPSLELRAWAIAVVSSVQFLSILKETCTNENRNMSIPSASSCFNKSSGWKFAICRSLSYSAWP